MPFIPHTEAEVRDMLAAIGAGSIDELFAEIPPELRCGELKNLPEALSEMAVCRLMEERAAENRSALCFAGAGAYEHYIPAAVWEIALRGEFYSAYTPYQAEASQGSLQVFYEYQSMMAGLMAMDVSNASLYDGASALGEAILMALRTNPDSRSRRVLLPRSLNPAYQRVARTLTRNQQVELVDLDYDRSLGRIAENALAAFEGEEFAAVVIPQPNYFGVLEEVDILADWAHRHGARSIAVVNPTAMALLKPPGEWGEHGADLACGEGQPLGIPLSAGGPYVGFLCSRQDFVHQLPGRLVGRTVDVDGRAGFTLALQPREQHIRRGKATSNICTNQGLMVTAATLYMALMGPKGLRGVAAACHANTSALLERLTRIEGVEPVFAAPFFHEAAIRLPRAADRVLAGLAERGILGGHVLSADYPELGDALLVCATETRNPEDIEFYAATLAEVLPC
ncbi:aminomethyl-transferring glycine dehydrogenase subunit GcvPA [Methylococcus geothermalis]|uniref:Probable glycine dehydrogenase (decarboxylating) subunit 1 n=1 Tax=Methylococcus geothermalis TaxID=2681310 RepID=A0A858Q4Q0_9GAMM|nr:aminomethyl-transferring glycine dehydrogenase subunit GcvPA [Methylococcus geothermalis]QJD28788.1 aminomethyl-transferring glycine dehydrogenase subunit GcvPA [Methylococcus geothermalis]